MDSTMESPTIESPAMDSTMESPTIESPAMDSTLETPTIESPVGQWGDDAGDDSGDVVSEQTAEIELADLDLDLSGLVDISDESMIDEAPLIDDEAAEPLQDLADDVDSTAEMRNLDEPNIGDTAEQPFARGGDTAEQPNFAAVADDDLMLGSRFRAETGSAETARRSRGLTGRFDLVV